MQRTAFIAHLESEPKSPLRTGIEALLAPNSTIIDLGTAENHLCDDLIIPKITNLPNFPNVRLTYASAFSNGNFFASLARLYKDYLGIDAQPDQFILGTGISFLVERIALVLCEPGDVVMLPAPVYPGFAADLWMSRTKLFYFDLNHLPETPPENARFMILTNPGNPVGDKIKNVDEIFAWAKKHRIHVFSDDIYALSNREGEKYQSIAGLPNADPEFIHQFYGISKDWGMAGLHLGFFWTRNKDLQEQMRKACGTTSIPGDTMQAIENMFSDIEWRDSYIKEFQRRLKDTEKKAIELYAKGGINVRKSPNSLFLLLDLRDIAPTEAKELEVFERMFKDFSVLIHPGRAYFRMEEIGWYRMCFSQEDSVLVKGINNIIKGVQTIRAGQ